MKKILTTLTTAIFFAIACSLIDQLIWNNEFYWVNALVGFFTGAILSILSKTQHIKNTDSIV